MIVILFGPPGAGKGTQGALLRDRLGLPHLSTGDMLREIVAGDSELGREIGATLARGAFADSAMVLAMVEDRIRRPDCDAGFVLDGFPRTLPQALALDDLLAREGRPLDVAIQLLVGPDAVAHRLLGRAAASGNPRPDDRAEVIPARLERYRDQTGPAIEHYRSTRRLASLDGQRNVESVHRGVVQLLRLGRSSARRSSMGETKP